MLKQRYIIAILSILTIASCATSPSETSGTNSVVYEPDGYVDVMSNFEAVVNKSNVYVNNARPYEEMIGAVMADAKNNRINGKGISISDITIRDVSVTTIALTNVQEIDTLGKYLQGGTLVLSYINSSSVKQELVLGALSNVDYYNRKIVFSVVGADITSFMENRPDNLTFALQLNGRPSIPLKVKYNVGFNFAYAYQEKENK